METKNVTKKNIDKICLKKTNQKKQRMHETMPQKIYVLKTVKVDVVTNSINDEKDNIDYSPFVDDDHDPLDGSPLGFR